MNQINQSEWAAEVTGRYDWLKVEYETWGVNKDIYTHSGGQHNLNYDKCNWLKQNNKNKQMVIKIPDQCMCVDTTPVNGNIANNMRIKSITLVPALEQKQVRSVYSPAHEAALREDVWTVPERLMAGPAGQRVAAFCPKEKKKREVKI